MTVYFIENAVIDSNLRRVIFYFRFDVCGQSVIGTYVRNNNDRRSIEVQRLKTAGIRMFSHNLYV